MAKRKGTSEPESLLLDAFTALTRLAVERAVLGPEKETSEPSGRARLGAAALDAVLGSARPARPASSREALAMASGAVLPAAIKASSSKVLRKQPLKIAPKLDPRLQAAVARSKMGAKRHKTTSATADEIPVLARVKDVSEWVGLSEVREGSTIGKLEGGDTLVTARIPVKRIEAVRQNPNVLSLKAAQPIFPALEATVRDLGIKPPESPSLPNANEGAGVVVGIVDFGCDFVHENFRESNGRTRVELLWDQAGPPTPQSPHGYGRVHTRADIDAAIDAPNPYSALGYFPEGGDHGTHVMDIACGNGRGTQVAGCAPKADIIFVQCSTDRLPWTGQEAVGVSFGDSVQLLEAVQFIFDAAGDRPCVVNLSLGTNGGPHDGSTLVEQGLDTIVRAKPNRAIVIAASNSQADGIHTLVEVQVGGSTDLVWNTLASVIGHELEIWMPAACLVAIELFTPDGSSLGLVEPNDTLSLGLEGELAVFVSNRLDDSNNHDNFAGVFLAGNLDPGAWGVRVHSRSDQAVSGHAWIERNDGAQSSFESPVDTHTLGSISCGRETIVVGSYDAHKPQRPVSFFSSSGPTRDGRQKPEICAPGHAVVAADSLSGDGTIRMSGTSMAAPAVTGLVALVLAAARSRGQALSITQIRDAIRLSARHDPLAATQWDARMGAGRAHAGALTPLGQSVLSSPAPTTSQAHTRTPPS